MEIMQLILGWKKVVPIFMMLFRPFKNLYLMQVTKLLLLYLAFQLLIPNLESVSIKDHSIKDQDN